MMREQRGFSLNKDVEHLARVLAAGLTLVIMVNAVEGDLNAVFAYFERRLPLELAWLPKFASFYIGPLISYKFFKIVLSAILLGSVVNTMRGGSSLSVLGF